MRPTSLIIVSSCNPAELALLFPFVVCWVASKFYQKRPELFGRLSTCVRKLAFETPGHGFKSVEIVQSYLILTCYGLPVERFELDQAVSPRRLIAVRACVC